VKRAQVSRRNSWNGRRGRPSRCCSPRLLLGVAALLLSAASLSSVESALSDEGPHPWAKFIEAGLVSSQAETQGPSRCEGVVGGPFGTDPNWVRVGGNIDPGTAFYEVSGQVLPDTPFERNDNPRIAPNDNSWSHFSKDINAWLTLDPSDRHLLADGNFVESGHREHGKLEIEWERGAVPLFAFPTTGDRMTVWGPLIWDCGHGDDWVGGGNYRTEIHPPVGWVVYRNTADRDGIPDSEEKRTRDPWLWYGPGDRPGTAARFGELGALPATVADVFFSSFGGDAVEELNGYSSDEMNVTGPQTDHWRQMLLQQDYSFFVPAPPRPPGRMRMFWRREDRCGQVPRSPGNPPGGDIDGLFEAGDLGGDPEAESLGPPACTIPDVVQRAVLSGRPGILVTVLAQSSGVQYPPSEYISYAKRYKVAWRSVQAGRTYRIDFESLRVYDDHEPCFDDGEWMMSLRVNEAWIHAVRGHGDGGRPFWTTGAIDDGQCGDPDPYKEYRIDEQVTVSVRPGQALHIYERSIDLETIPGQLNEDNPLINVIQTGEGRFVSGVRNSDVAGAHTIVYTITDISPPPTSI
jgi:hypothetical protein